MNETKAPEIIISDAKLIDVVILKDTMRDEHKLELQKLNNQNPEEGLLDCYIRSRQKYTLRIDGKISMMFGVIEKNSREGCIWALGNNELDAYPFHIAKLARHVMSQFLIDYDILFNYVDAGYERGIKFAKFLGALIDGGYVVGIRMASAYKVTFVSEEGEE